MSNSADEKKLKFEAEEIDLLLQKVKDGNLDVAIPVQSVNGKIGDVTLSADDVKARPDTWTPSAADVGADSAGTASSAVTEHNTATDAHNDIRLWLSNVETWVKNLLDADDETLNQTSEMIAYMKDNRELIEQITTGKVSVTDIINNLTTNVSDKPLSAAQGVVLKGLIDALQTAVNSKAASTDLTAHTGNSTVHITVAERTAWNKNTTDIESLSEEIADLNIPTKTSELANDSNFATMEEVNAEISSDEYKQSLVAILTNSYTNLLNDPRVVHKKGLYFSNSGQTWKTYAGNYGLIVPIDPNVTQNIIRFRGEFPIATSYNTLFTSTDGVKGSSKGAVDTEGYLGTDENGDSYIRIPTYNKEPWAFIPFMAQPSGDWTLDMTADNMIITLNEPIVESAIEVSKTSPLHGKSVSFNGDSICAGTYYTGGYGKIIADTYDMTYENIAVGGATIIQGLLGEDGVTPRHSVSATIANMSADADYIIVEGGLNDANESRPLGAITDGYDDTLNTSTFYGAFEYMCKELVTRFAGKKIGYIATHKRVTGFDSRYTENSYYYAAKKCCEKWGVPFCDLNTLLPPLSLIESLKNVYMGDSFHPNEFGYRLYYVPKIVAFMESL